MLSATRPLMEAVTRDRVARLAGVQLRDGATVTGLQPSASTAAGLCTRRRGGVEAAAGDRRLGPDLAAAAVVPELGHPPVEQVDAQVGYASRLYRQRGRLPVRTGMMIFGAPQIGTAGLALPVEDRHWLITAAGFGDRRPPGTRRASTVPRRAA